MFEGRRASFTFPRRVRQYGSKCAGVTYDQATHGGGAAFSMLRVGYPSTLAAELLLDFPAEIELIPMSDQLDHDVDIDVWIPDPYPTRALRAWPQLRGVRLVLSLMAGTEWIPGRWAPHVTICNAHGAHNISTAEWTLAAILAMLKYFPLFLDIQRSGRVEAALRSQRALRGDHRRHAADLSAGDAGGTHRQDGAAGGYGAIGKEIERMLEPFHVEMVRVARRRAASPRCMP